jgi:hypothetical protein
MGRGPQEPDACRPAPGLPRYRCRPRQRLAAGAPSGRPGVHAPRRPTRTEVPPSAPAPHTRPTPQRSADTSAGHYRDNVAITTDPARNRPELETSIRRSSAVSFGTPGYRAPDRQPSDAPCPPQRGTGLCDLGQSAKVRRTAESIHHLPTLPTVKTQVTAATCGIDAGHTGAWVVGDQEWSHGPRPTA